MSTLPLPHPAENTEEKKKEKKKIKREDTTDGGQWPIMQQQIRARRRRIVRCCPSPVWLSVLSALVSPAMVPAYIKKSLPLEDPLSLLRHHSSTPAFTRNSHKHTPAHHKHPKHAEPKTPKKTLKTTTHATLPHNHPNGCPHIHRPAHRARPQRLQHQARGGGARQGQGPQRLQQVSGHCNSPNGLGLFANKPGTTTTRRTSRCPTSSSLGIALGRGVWAWTRDDGHGVGPFFLCFLGSFLDWISTPGDGTEQNNRAGDSCRFGLEHPAGDRHCTTFLHSCLSSLCLLSAFPSRPPVFPRFLSACPGVCLYINTSIVHPPLSAYLPTQNLLFVSLYSTWNVDTVATTSQQRPQRPRQPDGKTKDSLFKDDPQHLLNVAGLAAACNAPEAVRRQPQVLGG